MHENDSFAITIGHVLLGSFEWQLWIDFTQSTQQLALCNYSLDISPSQTLAKHASLFANTNSDNVCPENVLPRDSKF